MRFLIPVSYALVLIVALALALTLALALARIPLSEFVATRAMQAAGLENATVNIRQLDTSLLEITALDFTRTTAGGISRVEAADLRIHYQFMQLVKGELDDIHVKRLLLQHETAATAPDEPLDQAALRQQLNADWRAFMPVNSIEIDRIELQGTAFGPLDHTAHQLQMHKTGSAIEARLTGLGANTSNRLLTASLTDDSLIVELNSTKHTEVPVLHASMKSSADGINIHWRLLPAPLEDWLEPYLHTPRIGCDAAVNGSLTIDLATPGRITAKLAGNTKSCRIAAYQLRQPVFGLEIRATTAAPDKHIDLLPGSYLHVAGIDANTFSIGNVRLDMHATITKSGGRWAVDGVAASPRLPVVYSDYTFVLKDVHNRVHVGDKNITLKSLFSPAELPGQFVVDVRHETKSASGTARLSMPQPIDLDGEGAHLGQLLESWTLPFDLVSGALQLDVNAGWSGGELNKLDMGIRLTNTGGHFNELLFSGLNYRQQLALLPKTSSPKPGEFTLEHIDAGIAIENVSAQISVGPSDYGALPKLIVNDLIGHLFDGNFTADRFAYDLNTPANSLDVHVHDIDLASVVASQQLGDIEVSGRVDGDLPVELSPKGVFINNGNLHNATPEGIIRYTPTAGTGELDRNPLTGIALKALSDFHYDVLKTRANYAPDGTLTLNFELSGTSPPLQTSRPVHLNINTEQNLLSLLKSIRYVDGLNQGLDKNVREMYQHLADH